MSKNCDVLVVGFDALDQGFVRKWAAEGKLPTFASLLECSYWGLVENEPGLQAGTAWPSFYRGVSVARHGQLDGLRQFNKDNYEIEVNIGEDKFKHDLIWRRLSKEGKRCAIIDAPYTYLTKNLNGIEVHDWGTHVATGSNTLQTATWPPDLVDELTGMYGSDPLGGHLCDELAPRTAEEIADFRDKLIDRLQKKAEMSVHLLKKGYWDFFLTTFSEAHCVGHQCWQLHDETRPDYEADVAAVVGNPMKDVYIALDRALGRILSEVDQTETTVMVYCSHGIEPSICGTYMLDKILTRLEGRELKDKAKGSEGIMRKGWRMLPESVKKHLQPLKAQVWQSVVGSPMQGHREERKFFEILANNSTGGVRVNLKGREAQGIVEPGEEYDRLLDQLIADLSEVVNMDTGKPAISGFAKTRDLYKDGESMDKLPDLLVDWNKDAGYTGDIRKVYSPKTGEIEHDAQHMRTGDHGKTRGMFLAVGPHVTPGHRNELASVLDMAPTIASLLGTSMESFDGQPIDRICDRPKMKAAGS